MMDDLSGSDSRYRVNEFTHQIDLVRPDNLIDSRYRASAVIHHITFFGILTSLAGAQVKG